MAKIGEDCMTVGSFVPSFFFFNQSSSNFYLSHFHYRNYYYCWLLLFLYYCINYCGLLFPKSNRTSQSLHQKTSSILIERDTHCMLERERVLEFTFPTLACQTQTYGIWVLLKWRISGFSPIFVFHDRFLVSGLILKPKFRVDFVNFGDFWVLCECASSIFADSVLFWVRSSANGGWFRRREEKSTRRREREQNQAQNEDCFTVGDSGENICWLVKILHIFPLSLFASFVLVTFCKFFLFMMSFWAET